MNALYLDSSAFVKLIVAEAETEALRAYLVGTKARFVSSTLLRTEALGAVRGQGAEALATVRAALRRIDLVAIVTCDQRMVEAAELLGLPTASPS